MAEEIKMVKVQAKANVHLAGREHSKESPAVFEAGQTATIDEGTALANPHFFTILE